MGKRIIIVMRVNQECTNVGLYASDILCICVIACDRDKPNTHLSPLMTTWVILVSLIALRNLLEYSDNTLPCGIV